MATSPASACLNRLRTTDFHRLGPAEEAGLWQLSLPWPCAPAQALSLAGKATDVMPLGQWPDTADNAPRRLLLTADGGNDAPDFLSLEDAVEPAAAPPTARLVKFAECEDLSFGWERHYLEVSYGSRTAGLLLGMMVGEEVHWWEACALEVTNRRATCLEIEVGGAIPHEVMTPEKLKESPGLENRFLHWHNWLNGHLYLRLHANGVCEVFAHHINSKFFDPGRELTDMVPVIGLLDPERTVPDATWDGSHAHLSIAGNSFDLTEAARLATPEKPGNLAHDEDFLVWQPYEAAELFGGVSSEARQDDEWIVRSEQRRWPKGMARTVRFSFSLSDRSPRVARYLAPYWWYGATAELYPMALLPVSNALDERLEKEAAWTRPVIHQRGFEDGALARGAPIERPADAPERWEPSWEGDIPMAMFLWAYRTGDAVDYDNAMRATYHFTDLALDHADNLARMHGFPPQAFSLPMNRVLGTVQAYLETGDPYLLNAAEGVVEASHRLHLNSWPRMATGRDACYLRGAVMLYRYFANDHFRAIARRGISTVINSQLPNGSWGDQGGGSGLHQWGAYITKPWMGLLATSPLLDYIQLFPDDQDVADCLVRFGDWLLANRWQRDGIYGWSYQHSFRDGNKYFDFYRQNWVDLPSDTQWHRDSLGRLLGWCSFQTGKSDYLDAYMTSLSTANLEYNDHGVSASLQFLPWLQAKLWQASPGDGAVRVQPRPCGAAPPPAARLYTPDGLVDVDLSMLESGNWPEGIEAGAPEPTD